VKCHAGRVSWWNTIQDEGEGVLLEYHEGRRRGWNTMHEGRGVKCPGWIPN
jgi:hypothetical protein